MPHKQSINKWDKIGPNNDSTDSNENPGFLRIIYLLTGRTQQRNRYSFRPHQTWEKLEFIKVRTSQGHLELWMEIGFRRTWLASWSSSDCRWFLKLQYGWCRVTWRTGTWIWDPWGCGGAAYTVAIGLVSWRDLLLRTKNLNFKLKQKSADR